MIVNTQYFREAALNREKYGYYVDAPTGSKDYLDFWRREQQRCLHGLTIGDTTITGYHYFYLNYCPILKVPDEIAMGDTATVAASIENRDLQFPAFWDGDYEFFWVFELAKNGLLNKDGNEDWEAFNRLGIESSIASLKGGYHLVVLKARGRGFTYKIASMLARNYFHKRKSNNYAMASDQEYLISKGNGGILGTAWDTINYIDLNTAWTQPRITDGTMSKTCGKKVPTNGGYAAKGRQNTIEGITLKDKPHKAAGKRGELMVYEEAGIFPELKEAWNLNLESMRQDSITFGTMLAFGTGGTRGADFGPLNELFNNPEPNQVVPFYNIYEEGLESEKISYFFPVYKNMTGYMDIDGNSKVREAIEREEERRSDLKANGNPQDLELHKAKNPMSPSEASLEIATNAFPTNDLSHRKKQIRVNGEVQMGTPGKLVREDGVLRFRIDNKLKPYYSFPVRREDDKTGCIVIFEAPQRDQEGKIPSNLYIICHDPFAHDSVEGLSLGATYVIKNPNMFSHPDDMIVASYVGRPESIDTYNDNLFRLAQYYNAKIGFENDRGDVIGYAKRYKLTHWLATTPDILSNTSKRKKKPGSTRSYGISLGNYQRKCDGEGFLADWLKQKRGANEDGEHFTNMDMIRDPGLVEELMQYNRDKGNFDRVMALIVGMYFMRDLNSPDDNASSNARRMPRADELDKILGKNAVR